MQSMAPPPVAARPPSAPAPSGARVSFPNNSQDQQRQTTASFTPPPPGATPLPPPHATLTALPPRAAAAGGHGYGYGYGAYVRPVNAADENSRRHSDAAAVAVAPPRYPVASATPDLAIITAQALDLMRQLERVNAENERLVVDVASRVKQVKEVLKIDPTASVSSHPPSSPSSVPTAHHLGLSPPVIVADFPPVEPSSATTQTSPVAEHAAPLRDMIDVGCEAVLPDVLGADHASKTARDASAAAFPDTNDQGSSPHASSETLMAVEHVGRARHEAVVAEAAMQTDPRIEALQQDNAALAATLKEYESTLELIMSKFRAQVQAAQDDKKRLHRDLQVHLAAERDRSDQLAREKTQAMEKLDAAQAIMRTSLRLAAEEDRDWAEQVAALQVEVETLRATLDSVQTAAESSAPAGPADKDGAATRSTNEENAVAVAVRDVNAASRSVPVVANGSAAAVHAVPVADPRPASEADVDLAAAMNDDDDGHDVSIPPGLPQFDAGFSAIPAVNVTIARRPASPEVAATDVDPASVPAPPSPARPSMGLPDVVMPHEPALRTAPHDPAPPTDEADEDREGALPAVGPGVASAIGEDDAGPVRDPESSVEVAGDTRAYQSDAEGDTSIDGISDSGHSSSAVGADEHDEGPGLVLKLEV
ncbi:hypothetical protein GGF31_006138 [Allomyces arbusculus]|nr:hypothetical protein GGF31_006138 [Allomyces arbusculus]